MKPRLLTLAAAMVLANPLAALAASDHKTGHAGSAMVAAAPSDMSDGEVRKIDKAAKKITLKHGEIRNLDMPPMTMVFQVKDPALLDKVKAGDKVKFTAEQVSGALVVTGIEPAK